MSLNNRQIAATRAELAANLALSGLSKTDIAATLRLDGRRVQAAIDVSGAQPEDVWLVRDYLDRVIRSTGSVAQQYTALTEGARTAAQSWFPLANIDAIMDGAAR